MNLIQLFETGTNYSFFNFYIIGTTQRTNLIKEPSKGNLVSSKEFLILLATDFVIKLCSVDTQYRVSIIRLRHVSDWFVFSQVLMAEADDGSGGPPAA